METYDEYLKRVEPIIDRYDKLEKEANFIKNSINALNYEVIKLLDRQDLISPDALEYSRIETELNSLVYDIEKLSEQYYFVKQKLMEL